MEMSLSAGIALISDVVDIGIVEAVLKLVRGGGAALVRRQRLDVRIAGDLVVGNALVDRDILVLPLLLLVTGGKREGGAGERGDDAGSWQLSISHRCSSLLGRSPYVSACRRFVSGTRTWSRLRLRRCIGNCP